MVRTNIFCATGILLAAALVYSQQQPESDEIKISGQAYTPQPSYRLQVETRLVDIGAVVRDGHGRAVAGLKREDFRITDQGKERTIGSFSEDRAASPGTPQAPGPAGSATVAKSGGQSSARYLALFFDDVNGAYGEDAGDLKRAQAAASRFVKDPLPPGLQIAIFTASGAQTLDFTSDGAKLTAAIAELKPHPRLSPKACPSISPYQAYRIAQTTDQETLRLVMAASGQHKCPTTTNDVMVQSAEIWSAVKRISTETLATTGRIVSYLGGKPGQRVLLIASSGFAGETLEPQQDRIIELAVHSGVVINSLVTKGLYNELTPGERFSDPAPARAQATGSPRYQGWVKAEVAETAERPMVMDDAMANLARGTGGVLFHNNNDLNAGFRETSIAPDVSYRMTFSPEGVTSDGSFHELKVSLVHGASYSVEARPGYFAQPVAAPDPLRAKLESEVMALDQQADVPAGLAIRVEKHAENERLVHVVLQLDISKLAFANHNDRRAQRVTFVGALFDEQGKIISAREGRMDLALKQDTYERLSKSGLNGELSFQVAPGLYKLRAVVLESVTGKLAASTYPIDVR